MRFGFILLIFSSLFISEIKGQETIEGCYIREYRSKLIFVGIRPLISSGGVTCVCLNLDSTAIYMDFNRETTICIDKYIVKGDSIKFDKMGDDAFLYKDNLYIYSFIYFAYKLKKANVKEMKQFVDKYGAKLKWNNLCYKDGYILLCSY